MARCETFGVRVYIASYASDETISWSKLPASIPFVLQL
jgi:hypothetical protein